MKLKLGEKQNNSSASNIAALSLLSCMKAEPFNPLNVHHEKLLWSQQYYSHVKKVPEQHPKVGAAWSKSVFPHYDAKLCIEVPENLIRSSTQAQEAVGLGGCEVLTCTCWNTDIRVTGQEKKKKDELDEKKKTQKKSTVPLRTCRFSHPRVQSVTSANARTGTATTASELCEGWVTARRGAWDGHMQ